MSATLKIFAAALALTLGGCVIPQGIAYMHQDAVAQQQRVVAQQQSAIVERTVVRRLKRLLGNVRIGSADCSRWRPSGRYFNVCRLSVAGSTVLVGLRYDEDRARTIADLQAAIVRHRQDERAIEALVPVEFGLRGAARCGEPDVVVLPVGASVRCVLTTKDERRHDMLFAVVGRLTPHEALRHVSGLRLVPAIAAAKAALEREYRANAAALSGHVVAAYFDTTLLPYVKSMEPAEHFKPVWCPPRVDARATTLEKALSRGCWMPSADGEFELVIFTSELGLPAFQNLSRDVNLSAMVSTFARKNRAYVRRHPGARAEVLDCGSERHVVLSLLSVHYCEVVVRSGRRTRIGIEYYDQWEGPHVVVEATPGPG